MVRRFTILSALLCAALTLVACDSSSGGDDIGGFFSEEVEITLKEQETTLYEPLDESTDVEIVIDAIVRAMQTSGSGFTPSDADFCLTYLSAAFSSLKAASDNGVVVGSTDVSVPTTLAAEYVSAILPLDTMSMPNIGTPTDSAYSIPYVSPGTSEVRCGGISSNGGDTYIAYADYVEDGVIVERYIITLKKNSYPITQSRYRLNYTVTAAAKIEQY